MVSGSRRPWRTFWKLVLAGILGSILLGAFFYPAILTLLARFLALSQTPERSDLIVVLGGEFLGARPLTAADLATRGYAPKVIISGTLYENRPESERAIQFLMEKGYPRELFIGIQQTAHSTIEEALVVCPELRRRRASKILLVTNAYHSRRANVVFRLFCPGIEYRSVAAENDQFHVKEWWKNPQFRQLFFSEWEKLLGTVFWSYPEYLLGGFRRSPVGQQGS